MCGACSLAGVDIYSFEQKINHIARHVQLPDAPALGRGATEVPEHERIPPILVINVQLPIYSVCSLSVSAQRNCCNNRMEGRIFEMSCLL